MNRVMVAKMDATTKKDAAYWRAYNAVNKVRRANTTRAWQQHIHAKVIAHYGGQCECCYDRTIEFLTVEPLKSGGRKAVGRSLVYKLWRAGLPDGYRVLCWNCTRSIRNEGYCPHRDAVI